MASETTTRYNASLTPESSGAFRLALLSFMFVLFSIMILSNYKSLTPHAKICTPSKNSAPLRFWPGGAEFSPSGMFGTGNGCLVERGSKRLIHVLDSAITHFEIKQGIKQGKQGKHGKQWDKQGICLVFLEIQGALGKKRKNFGNKTRNKTR